MNSAHFSMSVPLFSSFSDLPFFFCLYRFVIVSLLRIDKVNGHCWRIDKVYSNSIFCNDSIRFDIVGMI